MAADLNSILIGYKGKLDMLKTCFGSSEDTPTGKKKSKPSVDDFKSFARSHNAMIKQVKVIEGK